MSKDKKVSLTPKQERFCQLYATTAEFFGNGVQSYIEAYDIDVTKKGAYAAARSSAYDNLTKPDILARIDELIEEGGLNDQYVDKQLLIVITQNADYSSKVAAMREYNKLKQRIVDRQDITSKGEKIVIPILGGLSQQDAIQSNNSDQSTAEAQEED